MNGLRDTHRRRDLLVGLAVVLPIALVGVIVYWTATAATEVVLRIVVLGETFGLRGAVAAVGLVVGLAIAVPLLLIGIGVGVRHRFGQRVVTAIDRGLGDVPAIGPVYSGLRRSREAIAGEAFSEVVRVEVAEGVHAMAFLVDRPETHPPSGGKDAPDAGGGAGTDGHRMADVLDAGAETDDLVTVFLPFAPNPAVGGHLLGVRADRIETSDVSVAEGLGILVGFGPQTATPETDHPLGSFYTPDGSGDESDPASQRDRQNADGPPAN